MAAFCVCDASTRDALTITFAKRANAPPACLRTGLCAVADSFVGMGSVRETLGDYSTGSRRAAAVSIFMGAALVIIGVVGDCRGWWHDLSFVPNAITSLAGFFVGVPVALVLLSTITQEREDKSERDKLEQLSSTAWEQFAQRVTAFCAPDRIRVLHLAAKRLAPVWADSSTQIRRFAGWDRGEAPADQEEYRALNSRFRPWADEIDGLLRHIDNVLPAGSDLQVEWVGVQRSWAVLDTYVKLQRFERGLGWIEDPIDSRLQHKMIRENNPIGFFSESHDLRNTTYDPAMQDIPQYLRHCADLGFDDLAREACIRTTPPNSLPPDRYAANASAAAEFLELLRRDVVQAGEVGGWPGA